MKVHVSDCAQAAMQCHSPQPVAHFSAALDLPFSLSSLPTNSDSIAPPECPSDDILRKSAGTTAAPFFQVLNEVAAELVKTHPHVRIKAIACESLSSAVQICPNSSKTLRKPCLLPSRLPGTTLTLR